MKGLETGMPGLPSNEGERLLYNFDIRQKHPLSKELYEKRGNSGDEFQNIINESKNPLIFHFSQADMPDWHSPQTMSLVKANS